MKSKNKITGNIGEELACNYLLKKKYKIAEKNWRYSNQGEIDIIAIDDKTLVFIEVKTRKNTKFGLPIEAVNTYKLNKIRTVASMYLNQTDVKYSACRFDVVGILENNGDLEINHLLDVYQF